MKRSILLFGDSLTELGFGIGETVGWASLLASRYSRRADIWNRGFRGYTTNMALHVLPNVLNELSASLSAHTVLFCTVWLGTNDAVLPEDPRHVPVDRFQTNLETIIRRIRTHLPSIPVILLTPPPCDIERRTEFCLQTYGNLDRARRSNENARLYAQAVRIVGQEHECSVVNVFECLGGDGTSVEAYRDNLSDGVHLTARGNTLVYRALVELIDREYPHLAPMTDGDGRHGTTGVPLDQKLWDEFELEVKR